MSIQPDQAILDVIADLNTLPLSDSPVSRKTLVWESSGFEETASPAPDTVLRVYPRPDAAVWTWQWSRRLADGICAHHFGEADSKDEACAAAERFSPTCVFLRDEGHVVQWWETQSFGGGPRWTTALDGEMLQVEPLACRNPDDQAFAWTRDSRAWARVAGYFGRGPVNALCGSAPTLTAAMMAAIQAPERLRLDCAATIAAFAAGVVGAEAFDDALRDLVFERLRQIGRGHTPEHDDRHTAGELGHAAEAYLAVAAGAVEPDEVPRAWPWSVQEWERMRPTDADEALVQGAALALAEIERRARYQRRTGRDWIERNRPADGHSPTVAPAPAEAPAAPEDGEHRPC